jgi:putative oxidoreductase
MALDKLVLRSVVGGLLMGHGLQKLNGSFGGPGLDGTEKMMKGLGMYPPEYHARAVALSETIGGGLTALGFLSPLGPAMIMGTMAVAIQKVHLKNGLWAHKQGYEFNLTLIAASFALAADGPGLLSIDWMLRKQRKGLGWALAAAAAAGGAAAVVLRVADRMAPSSADTADGVADEAPVTSAKHESDRPTPDLSEEGHSGHDHSGHDHSDHDHSDHDHSDHDHSDHDHPGHDHSEENGSDQDHSHDSGAYNS